MSEPCWGFHASQIPPDTNEVVDTAGRHYERHGGGWIHVATMDGQKEYGAWTTEENLLLDWGPVRCPTAERLLEAARAPQHVR